MQLVVGILLGVIGIFGRYSWNAIDLPYSIRGLAVTTFFFVIALPVLYFLAKEYLGPRPAWIIFLVAAVICAFPYHLLGLDSAYFPSFTNPTVSWKDVPAPATAWLFSANSAAAFHATGLFLFLLAAGGIAAWILAQKRPVLTRHVWFFFALFCLILGEAWLHQGLRSPYTYIPHYERPPLEGYWYHHYLLPNLGGAVNTDYPKLFFTAEEIFIGARKLTDPIACRIFPYFISSQFTRFINPYYVWIVLNVSFWMLAILAMYTVAREWLSVRAARIAAFLLAVGQGPIVYVAQPMPYVCGIMSVVITLAVFFRLFPKGPVSRPNALIFAGFFTLVLLTYEHQPWMVLLPFVAWLAGRNIRWTVGSLLIGLCVSSAFLQFCRLLPETTVTGTLGAASPFIQIKSLLLSGSPARMLGAIGRTLYGFNWSMTAAFNGIWFVSLVGLVVCLWKKQRGTGVMALFFVPALMTYSLFELGSSVYVTFPRIVYSAYPAVFLFTAALLDRLMPAKGAWRKFGWGLGVVLLALEMVRVNADVFGSPAIYVYWFYRQFIFSLTEAVL